MILSSYSEIGKREINEDYIAFHNNIFVLCDGVGGAEHGEIASKFVAEKLVEYFDRFGDNSFYGNPIIQDILLKIQIELNNRLKLYPAEIGMGTTLAAVLINQGSAYVFHIGDSRVYYIRASNRTFWCTTDHSVVSELINSGVITEVEALTHPMRNRITRAIQSNSGSKTAKAEINIMSEMKTGDIIFICSDGVLEAIEESILLEVLINQELSVDEKINIIKQACLGISNDNNSALLLEMEHSDEILSNQKIDNGLPMIELTSIDEKSEDKNSFFSNCSFYVDLIKKRTESNRPISRMIYVLSIAMLTLLILFLFGYFLSSSK